MNPKVSSDAMEKRDVLNLQRFELRFFVAELTAQSLY
jgi:hypothetical protein